MHNKKLSNLINSLEFNIIEGDLNWINLLKKYRLSNLHNSVSWGKYKSKCGWKTNRILIDSKNYNNKIGVFQLQTKRFGLFKIHLIQGGIKCLVESEEFIYSSLYLLTNNYLKLGIFDVLLIHNFEEKSDQYNQALLSFGFEPYLASNMYSFYLKLPKEKKLNMDVLHKNWRHNLRRSLNHPNLKVHLHEKRSDRIYAIDQLKIMYIQLMNRKAFRPSLDINKIKEIIVDDDNFIVLSANLFGEIAAIRIGYISNNFMSDFLAASNNLSIKTYANYLLLWKLIEKCKSMELHGFECGGIDPYKMKGVYNFKRGLGADLTQIGPLWIYQKNQIGKKFLKSVFSLI